jgi:hypothetical protein
MKKLNSILVLIFMSLSVFAQDSGIEMADELRKSGKFFVVVAVIVAIFLGIIIGLFTIDRRIKKLEQRD